jgi:type IV secretory pathway VirB2 component (pilin)
MTKTLNSRLFLFAVAALTLVLPNMAFAQSATGLGDVGRIACSVYACVTGNGLFAIIATMAIFFLGIGAFFGKVNWGLVIVITLGIVVIVGAAGIASTLTGSDCDGTTNFTC